jgi:hypothetical protein
VTEDVQAHRRGVLLEGQGPDRGPIFCGRGEPVDMFVNTVVPGAPFVALARNGVFAAWGVLESSWNQGARVLSARI